MMMTTQTKKAPCVLIIRDGWGYNPNETRSNAIHKAHTPVSDALVMDYWPRTLLRTHGRDVGLPTGIMGNSEVGHQNIGAGRIVDQEILRLDKALESKVLDENPVFREISRRSARYNSALHLMGLVSDGGVHSHIRHLIGLVRAAKRCGIMRVFIHVFTDGRDTGPQTGLGFIETLQKALDEIGLGKIASLCGRFWSMDRDERWERVQKAYLLLTGQVAKDVCRDPREAIKQYYAQPSDPSMQGDEFIPPTWVLNEQDKPLGPIQKNDNVLFFNFRGDRPRQLCRAFLEGDFPYFDRGQQSRNICFATLTDYKARLCRRVLFPKPDRMVNTLGEFISKRGLKQFRCAETEKYPHVTFFFNDYRNEPFEGESRHMVPSPRDVATYDQKPEMSAKGVTEATCEAIRSGKYDFIVVNYANADMVGHTGSLEAAIKACEAVDQGLGELLKAIDEVGGKAFITADHGNADQMWDGQLHSPHTRHTMCPVEAILYGKGCKSLKLKADGRLADIAPTLLHLMQLPVPGAMTGEILLVY